MKKTPRLAPVLAFSILSLLILLPLLRHGFIFALDMVPTPVWRLPDQITSSYPFYALMHVLNMIIPADILQKILLFGIFLMAGWGMYRLSAWLKDSDSVEADYSSYFAGILYVLNPFTYSRLMAGQYAVLMGYALLPWFALAWLSFLRKPKLSKGVIAGVIAAITGIVSIHSLGLIFLIALISLVIRLWRLRKNSRDARRLAGFAALSAGVFLLASGFWLVPLLIGRGATAAAISGFGVGDQQAFSTTGSNVLMRLLSVGRLEGFWVEREGLYRMPQSIGLVWWLAFAFLLVLVVMGFMRFWKNGRKFEAAVFGLTILTAVVLAAGIFSTWLSQHVPFFAGYREPQKFAALIALGYAVFAGAGATSVLEWQPKKFNNAVIVATLGVFALPFVLTPSMLFGGGRQLAVHQFPDGWYTVNDRLNADPDQFKTLFLPWHLYMHFGFAGTIMANPADHFFDKEIIVSSDPEFGGSSPSKHDPLKDEIATSVLPKAIKGDSSDFASKLSRLGIKYVILASESDYEDYKYVDKQPDMQLIYNDESVRLYKNLDYK